MDRPGLKDDQLYEGRDVALTTDLRDVFGEIAQKHLGATNLESILPGYAGGNLEVFWANLHLIR